MKTKVITLFEFLGPWNILKNYESPKSLAFEAISPISRRPITLESQKHHTIFVYFLMNKNRFLLQLKIHHTSQWLRRDVTRSGNNFKCKKFRNIFILSALKIIRQACHIFLFINLKLLWYKRGNANHTFTLAAIPYQGSGFWTQSGQRFWLLRFAI